MRRLSGAAVFSLGLALVAAYAVYAALRWPPKAALFPLVMGIPLLVLALAQFVVELRSRAPAESFPGGKPRAARKASASGRMSSRRSRSGGTSMAKTLSR